MPVRPTTPQDSRRIATLLRAAFPAEEREDIVRLVADLESGPSQKDSLFLVTDDDQDLTGYIAFSPLALADDESWRGSILSPLAVIPEHQRKGIGSSLIQAGIEILTAQGTDWLFVYGDPAYYGRFGFDASAAEGYAAPCELTHPFGWQALRLSTTAPQVRGKLSCVEALRDPALW